MNIFILHNL